MVGSSRDSVSAREDIAECVIELGALNGGCNEGIMDGVRKMTFEDGWVRIYVNILHDCDKYQWQERLDQGNWAEERRLKSLMPGVCRNRLDWTRRIRQ